MASIPDTTVRYPPETLRSLYIAAIEEWDDPSQSQDRLKACNALFLWYWAAPGYLITRQNFDRCPEEWQRQAFDTTRQQEKISSGKALQVQLADACDTLINQRVREGLTNNLEETFRNCPASWHSRIFNPPPDRDYMQHVIVEPIVPRAATDRCQNGWVIVQFDISANGTTDNIQVVESSDRMFEDATIKAVQQWEFLPARRNGADIETTGVKMKVNFRIEPGSC